jgi:hypothetical protein
VFDSRTGDLVAALDVDDDTSEPVPACRCSSRGIAGGVIRKRCADDVVTSCRQD